MKFSKNSLKFGENVSHKPHGALNNMACEDIELATTILAKSINEISKILFILYQLDQKWKRQQKN